MSVATLSGRVEDASGAPLAGAQVQALLEERGQTWRAETDARGRFRFLSLPLGSYALTAWHRGFGEARRAVTLGVGQALDLVVSLTPAVAGTTVEVTEEAPLVETVRTEVAESVTAHEVRSLPTNGRHYLDLAALVPAVTRANPVANQRFPETSAVPGTGLSITGQRQIANSFVVDGLSANDDAADLPGTFFSQEVIREFQVVTSGGIAEFGRAYGGFVNVVTRSGGRAWTGEGYAFYRDDTLDARNPLAPRKDPLRQWQYGLSAGGPLGARTYLFGNLEQTRRDSTGVVTIPAATVDAVNARLRAAGYGGEELATGLFPTGYDTSNVLFRLDHHAGDRLLLTARYSLYDIDSPNARNVGGINAASRGTALRDRDHALALSAVLTLSPRTMAETRVQAARSRLAAPPNDLAGPAVNISGVAALGTATFSPTARDLDLYELVQTLTAYRGAHTLKLGADLLWNRLDIAFPGAVQGVYTFESLPAFAAGRYVTFQQAFGEERQFQSNPNAGLFVQDEWRVVPSLTLNLGLRYDLQDLPDPIRTDTDNLAPRLGLAWAPDGGRMVVRSSFGLYYDRIPLRATSNALQRDGTRYKVAVLPLGAAGAPVFPAVLPAFPAGLLASVTTIDPGILSAESRQASLQVERQLGAHTSASVAVLHVRADGIIVSRNVNVPTLSAAEARAGGVPNLGRPDPRFANVGRFESLGRSEYKGLTVSVNRRLSGGVSARLSYTLSKAMDDAGNAFFFTPQDADDLRAEWGRSDNDQRHRVVLAGSLEPRGVLQGWSLSGVFSYGSALPFNVVTGSDRNNDTNVNDRPPGVGRNTGVGFDFATLDLRLARRFALGATRVEAMVEAFNLLNRSNLQLPNNTFGTGSAPRPGFGAPTAAADSRQVQFGLRVSR
ncbi:MAG TPA: TonB-dependent receptor [Vicinamibacteria bacterium]